MDEGLIMIIIFIWALMLYIMYRAFKEPSEWGDNTEDRNIQKK